MAAYQALDFLGLIPDETAAICHPADEPAIRLKIMIERAEGFIRQRKGTHVIFTGHGPSAAATAIYCHARGCRGLWLRPPDPAGLIPRLRWEAGLEKIIAACSPCVETRDIASAPDWLAYPPLAGQDSTRPLEEEIPGLRPSGDGRRLALIAVLRRDWGYLDDTTSLLARAAGAWAEALPEVDWVVVSNLNARLEGPMRSLARRPDNLLLTPPLPYPVYRKLIDRARLVVTDGPLIGAEALQRGIEVGSLGDLAPNHASGMTPTFGKNRCLMPADLPSDAWIGQMREILAPVRQPTEPGIPPGVRRCPGWFGHDAD